MPIQKPRTAIFTVDVEQPYADGEKGVYDYLDIFISENIKATFFITGDVAENNPEIVKSIINEGHEIGSHGWRHPYISLPVSLRAPYLPEIDCKQLNYELSASHKILEDLGADVHGFRAMAFRTDMRVSETIASHFKYESSYSDYFLSQRPNLSKLIQLPIATLRGTNMPLGTPLLFGLPFKPFLKYLGTLTNSEPITLYSHSFDFIKCKIPLYTNRWKRTWYYNRCGPKRIEDVRSMIRSLSDRGFVFETGKSYIDKR